MTPRDDPDSPEAHHAKACKHVARLLLDRIDSRDRYSCPARFPDYEDSYSKEALFRWEYESIIWAVMAIESIELKNYRLN